MPIINLSIDVGDYGSNSDGGVWANSNLGQSMESDTGNIPPPKLLPGTMTLLPCTLVGDEAEEEAFPLKSYLMRPYPRKSLISDSQRIFNYCLSRARRTIENAFGILVSRWRILRKSIQCKEETAHKIVLALVVLHNYIMSSNERKYCPLHFVDQESNGIVIPGQWKIRITYCTYWSSWLKPSCLHCKCSARHTAKIFHDKYWGS